MMHDHSAILSDPTYRIDSELGSGGGGVVYKAWHTRLQKHVVIKELKRGSSIWAKTKGPAMELFQWQAGYGAFSVSQSQSSRVQRYIAGQEEHHRRSSFQDEFRQLLRKHGIEFDERYVWD